MQEDRDTMFAQMELSSAWLELLGQQTDDTTPFASNSTIPALESDPWRSLLHVNGVEIVDLQKVHLPMNDQDVEQMLQLMQEQSAPHAEL
ncbi:MAG: hypothetical protein NVS4B11_18360 [Ktedonobacteraceae bacterium]